MRGERKSPLLDFHGFTSPQLAAGKYIPYTDLTEESKKKYVEEHRAFAFSHSLTEQIGGLIESGFEITNIYEDRDGGGLFDKYMNSYVAVRAIKK